MANEISTRHVTKFDGQNFLGWKFQMKALFVSHEIDDIVSGARAMPDDRTTEAAKTWRKDNAKAMFLISSTMEYSQLESLLVYTTAKDMWDNLILIFEQKSASNKLLLTQRFHAYRMCPSDSVVQHITKVQNMTRQLLDVGEAVSVTTVMAKILTGLSEKFNYFHTAWDSVDPARQTLEYLKERLIQEENRLSVNGEEVTALAAMTNRLNINRNASGEKKYVKQKVEKKDIKDIKCFKCQEKGHFARKCQNKKKIEERDAMRDCALIISTREMQALINEADTSIRSDKHDVWLLDSGASAHITFHRDWLTEFRPSTGENTVSLGDDCVCKVEGVGTVLIEKFVDGHWQESKIENVWYVPALRKNLISVGVCTQKGYDVQFHKDNVFIFLSGNVVSIGVKQSNNIYRMLLRARQLVSDGQANLAASSLQLWHERLGHVNPRALKELSEKGLVEGMNISDCNEFFCEACQLGKSHKLAFKKAEERLLQPGEFIHSDVCGPMSEMSLGGARFFVTFKDDASSFRHVYMLKHKSDVLDRLKEFERMIANKFERRIKVLRTDNGTEYVNNNMMNYLRQLGIKHETTAPYTPEQNGKAERDNRTIVECARTMLQAKSLPRFLWAEAVNTSVYMLNRTLSKKNDGRTPYEIWTGRKPNLQHVRVFGSEAFVYVPKQLTNKFDARSKKAILVGYDGDSSNYRLYFSNSKKVSVSRHVVFNEKCTIFNPAMNESIEQEINIPFRTRERREENNEQQPQPPQLPQQQLELNDIVEAEERESNCDGTGQTLPEGRQLRNRANIKPPVRYEVNVLEFNIPENFQEAINGPEGPKWQAAINDELESHSRNETWKIVPRQPDIKTITSKWVFKVVKSKDGKSDRYKARLCARGFQQREGIDYVETFSPVVRYDSLRVLLAHITQHDLEMLSFDVRTAFLYGDLEETIHMEIPQGVEVETFDSKLSSLKNEASNISEVVCKLNKSLYGLKQAPRCWNRKFKQFLYKFNFKEIDADNCIFLGKYDNHAVYLALFVDDGLIACDSICVLNEIIKNLSAEFEITVGDASMFIGLQISRNRVEKKMFIHQKSYTERILSRFNMNDVKPVYVPADPNVILKPVDSECNRVENDNVKPYREAVGSLMYLSTLTRPDIAYAVSNLSKFLNNHDSSHWNAVKRVFGYLSGTLDVGITYQNDGGHCNNNLIGFSDADYANDLETRRSTTGYVFCMAKGPVTWSSQRQKIVTLSTTESEYVAAATAAKELVWLRSLINGIGYQCEKPTTLFVDNQSAIKLSKNAEFHKRTKHIDVRYHYIREKYESGEICIEYVPTEMQRADMFTKALPRDRFKMLCKSIGIAFTSK